MYALKIPGQPNENSFKRWTQNDKDWLIKHYPNLGLVKTADKMDRSVNSVRHYAHILGLKSKFKFNVESNYQRGSAFRGKKRPEHSKTLTGRKQNPQQAQKVLATKMARYGYYSKPNQNAYSHAKRGYYKINGKKIYFRSGWEANYALYLDWLIKQKQIKEWAFEEDTFWFEKIKRGVRSYCPDFKITNFDNTVEYHEVKGYMDDRSKTKINRMRIYHPKIKLIVIDQKCYQDIKNKIGAVLGFY